MPLDAETEQRLLAAAAAAGIDRLVVAAVIRDGDRVLLLERSPEDYLGGLFELPGGVVEPEETLHQALRREVAEETGLIVSAIDCYRGGFDYRSQGGRLTRQFNFQLTAPDKPAVILSEHAGFAWVGRAELAQYPVSPEVREVLGRVFESGN